MVFEMKMGFSCVGFRNPASWLRLGGRVQKMFPLDWDRSFLTRDFTTSTDYQLLETHAGIVLKLAFQAHKSLHPARPPL
jgi:hypothetical protein